MLTWACWSTQQYQHQNVTSVQQATWNSQESRFSCQSVYQIIHPTGVLNNYPTTSHCPQYYSITTSTTPSFPPQHQQRMTDITKDTEKYYTLTRFNDYSVHFPNRYGLSIDEVQNIFGEFGQITSCKQTGDQYGLCFINYKTEDGARNCVEGVKNHPKIKLRLTKYYRENKNDKKESNKCDKENDNQQYKGNNNSRQGSEKSFNGVEQNEPAKIMNDIPSAMSQSIYKNYSKMSINDIDNVANENQSPVEDQSTAPMEMPALIPASKKTISKFDTVNEPINLTLSTSKKPTEIIEAQEIIVANIEDNYGVPAILHLLEKYQPICASPIKICKSHSVRYCHVYFNNVHQAEAAERDFDDYQWSEKKKLIVLRINTLAELALSF